MENAKEREGCLTAPGGRGQVVEHLQIEKHIWSVQAAAEWRRSEPVKQIWTAGVERRYIKHARENVRCDGAGWRFVTPV